MDPANLIAATAPNTKPPHPPVSSVGTEFKQLIDSLKIPAPEGCDCEALRIEMDLLGVEGCRLQRDRLLDVLKENAGKVSWIAKLKAIGPAIATGLAFQVDAFDPVPGLFDEAIQRAETKQQQAPPRQRTVARAKRSGGCCGRKAKTDDAKESNPPAMTWAYGITTTPSRRGTLLPQTIRSLREAGFEHPVLFVDGCDDRAAYDRFELPVVIRQLPRVGNFANWWLGMTELYLRNPNADRFVIFEDDILACRNLRPFLEQTLLPENAYFNLFLFRQNERAAKNHPGWFESNQRGLGAQGLMFRREQLVALLSAPTMATHPQSPKGAQVIDGAIMLAMKEKGFKEYCHFPSLLQHDGVVTTIEGHPTYPPARSFPGEEFDALELLETTHPLEPICTLPKLDQKQGKNREKRIELQPLTGPANLMWFVYPRRETRHVWLAQQEKIRQAIEQFDGKTVCAIAVDDSTDRAALDTSLWDEIIELPNDPHERELKGWRWCMERLKDQPGFTVRLHAKGSWRNAVTSHLRKWWEIGYDTLLDVALVRTALANKIVVGPLRFHGAVPRLGAGWHFAGSFYAFRNEEIFSQEWEPKSHGSAGWYVEAWPALVASLEQTACLAFDGVSNLYELNNWHRSARGPAASASRSQVLPEPPTDSPELTATQRRFEKTTSRPLATNPGVTFSRTDPPEVAIVIAGRNNGRFLVDAIESSLNQSIPCEVVYADDCSTDESVRLALDYLDRGLRVLPSGIHRGACDARNRGAAATRAPFLIFLDADDRMRSTYAEDHLKAISSDAPFAHGSVQAFGDKSNLWLATPWSEYDLWRQNQVCTSSLWRRSVFDLVGGWDASVPSMWDWDLAIRMSRYGTPSLSRAILDYRIRRDSVSAELNEREEAGRLPFQELIRRKNARLNVSSLISGRIPELFSAWIDVLALSVRFANLPEKPGLQLWLHDDAALQRIQIQEFAEHYSDTFGQIELRSISRSIPTEPGSARGNAVASLLADYSARAQSATSADLMWFVEDDVHVPLDACRKMFDAVTAGNIPPIAVSGVYRNRHLSKQVLGGWLRNGQYFEPNQFSAEVQPVDFVGTGCLMFWVNRPGSPQTWASHVSGSPAHDWAWSAEVNRLTKKSRHDSNQGKILMHGGVRCGHAQSEHVILRP